MTAKPQQLYSMVNIRPERESGSWSDDWMTSPEIDEEAPLLAGTTMTSPRRESQCDTPTSQRGSQNSGRDRKVVLDLEDTTRLYHYMDEAAEFLLYQLDQENSRERRMSLFTDRPPRCAKVKAALSKVMIALTGAKGISATVLLQLVCLIMLTLVDALPDEHSSKRRALQVSSYVMLGIQTINLVIVVLISVQIAQQIQHRKVSRILLLQSYIAAVLLFSGIYTATYRLQPSSWKFVADPQVLEDPVQIVVLYTRFLFFSVSTATLCGAADALPKQWYTCLFVSAQMLLSFMYFTSVLGATIRKRKIPEIKRVATSKELMNIRQSLSRRP
ncbi:uncharacterized protein LOC128246738 isoform X2 [Mya arenaria]|uniref:uncharacterized protein LOC128246738 isoform X2 n=1 Tax=Mya arenaria TaxID=6604 RepID=UPI0022E1AD51|nr:uncharacterized protein LOC128246738 isoform X2 [Mya arenaria]